MARFRQTLARVRQILARVRQTLARVRQTPVEMEIPKNAWRVINRFLPRKENGEHISNIKLPDGSSLTDPSGIANHLNSHFAGVGQKMAACVNDNGVPPEYYI